MGDSKKESKMSKLIRFLETERNMSQKEVREYFMDKWGLKVSSSETSLAFKKMGLTGGGPDKTNPRKPSTPAIAIPVKESPQLRSEISRLRRQNNRLRKVIDALIDEEIDSLRN